MMTALLGPEFRRHLWTRFSLFSVAAIPLLIALAMLAVWMTYTASEEIRIAAGQVRPGELVKHWSNGLFAPAWIGFFLAAIVGGSYEAAAAFTNEQKNKTWDLQKISAIKPWHLVIGKLFGSTSYVWYTALLLLALFLYTFINASWERVMPVNGRHFGAPFRQAVSADLPDILLICAYMVLAGLFAQIAALLGSLQNLLMKKGGFLSSFILGIVIGGTVFKIPLAKIENISRSYVIADDALGNVSQTSKWFHYQIDTDLFILSSLAFFMFWAVVALYRFTRMELQFRNLPFVLLTFFVTFCIYTVGLSQGMQYYSVQYYPATFLMLIITYYSVFKNSDDLAGYRRLITAVRTRNVRKILEDCPPWAVSALVFAAMNILVFVYFDVINTNPGWDALQDLKTVKENIAVLFGSLWLFMIRDGIVMHIFFLGGRSRQATFKLIVYYALVYMLLPMIFLSGNIDWDEFIKNAIHGRGNILPAWPFFYPVASKDVLWGLGPVAFEIVLAGTALRWMLQRMAKRNEVVAAS